MPRAQPTDRAMRLAFCGQGFAMQRPTDTRFLRIDIGNGLATRIACRSLAEAGMQEAPDWIRGRRLHCRDRTAAAICSRLAP